MKQPEERKGFIVYYDMLEQFELLPREELGELFIAMLRYSKDGTEPDFDSLALKVAFSFFKRLDDCDRERYSKISQQRQAAGKKGAKARWENTA